MAAISKKTVLYADDDSTYRLTIPALLRRLGCNVTVVENGQLAVEAVDAETNFAFILLDNQMPVMGGLEAAKEILKKKKVKIVLFTSDEFEKVESSVNELGILYLKKPGSVQGFKKLLGLD